MSKKVLAVYGDPYQKETSANWQILQAVKAEYPELEIDDLQALYPDYQIDAAAEQEKLAEADVIILESPIYWYNMSSLMRRWLEQVLAYGWAYGDGGQALKGKTAILSVTAGADLEDYSKGPHCVIEEKDLLKPIQIIFPYCSMKDGGTVFSAGVQGMPEDQQILAAHAAKLLALIQNA